MPKQEKLSQLTTDNSPGPLDLVNGLKYVGAISTTGYENVNFPASLFNGSGVYLPLAGGTMSGNLNFDNFVHIVGSSSLSYLDVNAMRFFDHAGVNSLGANNRAAYDGSGQEAIQWGIRTLFNNVGTAVLQWAGAALESNTQPTDVQSLPNVQYIAQNTTMTLGKLIGADLNTTADQPIILQIVGGYTGTFIVVTDIIICNASAAVTTAADGEFWDGASRTGNEIAFVKTAPSDFLHTLVNVNSMLRAPATITLSYANNNTLNASSNVMNFSLGTPEGTPVTADIYIHGYIIQ